MPMLSIENFSDLFVKNYWATVKSDLFPMPPNEPVEESIEEILADISYKIKLASPPRVQLPYFTLQMNSKIGDWWRFGFKSKGSRWEVIECSAQSDKRDEPHDFLAPPYAEDFKPFLDYIVMATNAQRSI